MTQKLFHKDQYLQTFSSVVVEAMEVNGEPGVILEQTAFYPNSGGQPHDTGTLNDIGVVNVIEDEQQQIVHLLEKPMSALRVEGRINWERRFDHIQQHTGQHLLSQAFIQVCDAETISFHLGEESSTIDIHKAGLEAETVKSAESLANQIIYENREIAAHFVSKEEAQRFPVRKLPTVEENIRIIEIKDFDFSPCGGTHCSRSGEIGMAKIKRFENYKGGARIHFVCGWRALRDYQQKAETLRQISEVMSSGESELPQNVGKLQEEAKTLRREQNHLTRQLFEYEAKALLAEREKSGDIYILKKIFENRKPKDMKNLAMKVLEHASNTVILFGGKLEEKASLLFLRSEDICFDMGQLMKTACGVINGRGGGQAHQAQGGGTEVEKLEEALQRARDAVLQGA